MQPKILLLGLGNILLGDEGLGIQALERLQERYCLPDTIQVLDGGVLGLELLAYAEGMTKWLIIDAVQTGQVPGTIVRLAGAEVPAAFALKLSMHQVGFQEVLALCRVRGTMPSDLVVWGLEPEVLAPGVRLSETVAAHLEKLVERVVTELEDWGMKIDSKKEQVLR